MNERFGRPQPPIDGPQFLFSGIKNQPQNDPAIRDLLHPAFLESLNVYASCSMRLDALKKSTATWRFIQESEEISSSRDNRTGVNLVRDRSSALNGRHIGGLVGIPMPNFSNIMVVWDPRPPRLGAPEMELFLLWAYGMIVKTVSNL